MTTHHVSGFFEHREDAQAVLSTLVERGLPRDRLQIFENDVAARMRGAAPSAPDAPAGSNEVLKNMVVDGAIGTAVGTGIGVLAEVALVAANVSLFIASPLLAPLVLLGWGATVGGTIGAMVGAEKKVPNNEPVGTDLGDKQGSLSALIRDAIASGQTVLVAQTQTDAETAMARDLIQAAVGAYEDVVAA